MTITLVSKSVQVAGRAMRNRRKAPLKLTLQGLRFEVSAMVLMARVKRGLSESVCRGGRWGCEESDLEGRVESGWENCANGMVVCGCGMVVCGCGAVMLRKRWMDKKSGKRKAFIIQPCQEHVPNEPSRQESVKNFFHMFYEATLPSDREIFGSH